MKDQIDHNQIDITNDDIFNENIRLLIEQVSTKTAMKVLQGAGLYE